MPRQVKTWDLPWLSASRRPHYTVTEVDGTPGVTEFATLGAAEWVAHCRNEVDRSRLQRNAAPVIWSAV